MLHLNYKRPSTWILQLFGFVVLIYSLYGAILKSAYFEQRGTLLLVLSIYLILAAPLILILRALRLSRNNSRLSEEIEMEFLSDLLIIKGSSYKLEYKWEKIEKISETNFAYLIFISKNQAHILPKYAINREEELELRKILNSLNGIKLLYKTAIS